MAAVLVEGVDWWVGGGAETSALTEMLSATVEGQSSTTQLRCGAARIPTVLGEEKGTPLGLDCIATFV